MFCKKERGPGCGAGTPLKRTLRALVLAACLLALAAIVLLRVRQEQATLLGAALADGEDLAAITALPQTSSAGCALRWNGADLPYDAALDAYCLPQPPDGEARGTLSASWGSLALPADQWAGGWSDAMAGSELLDVYVSDGSRWCRLKVYLSGLPVFSIHTERSEPAVINYESRERNYGDVTLFWPEGNVRQQLLESGVEWHWRGNASLLSQKKSYRLNLQDEYGRAVSQDYLGLGEDDGWILVNFATDCTRSRDMVAFTLWNEMAYESYTDPYGVEMEYVELFVDDEYMGVFGLCRPLGRKTLDLASTDVLYKWRLANMMKLYEFDWMEEEQMMDYFGAIEIAWPNQWRDGVWDVLQPYIVSMYVPFSEVPRQTLETLMDVNNAIDTALFKQFICGVDNSMQNMYLIYRSMDGLIYRIPWDMNYSFGDSYDDFRALDLTRLLVPDLELDALYNADAANVRREVADRWQELRQGVFSLEHLEELFYACRNELEATGAWARDYGRWGENDAFQGWSENETLPLEETLDFMEERLEFLDEAMACYTPADRSPFPALPQ